MAVSRVVGSMLCVCALAGLLGAAPALAQQPGATAAMSTPVQAMARDYANLSDKFTGLARVMAGKYDWRPGQGVRSVGEVFNLIVTENKMLAGILTGAGGQAPSMGGAAPITDAAAMQEALKSSYAAIGQALSAMSPADLATPVTLFGRNTTKEGAVFILMVDQHEHLGQSIAYARSNSVVPPWSK